MRVRDTSVILLGLVALGGATPGCGGRTRSTDRDDTTASAPAPFPRDKLRYASLLLRGRDASADELSQWERDRSPVPAILDTLLTDPFLAEVTAPRLLFKHYFYGRGNYVVSARYKLNEASGTYYLVKPCPPAKAVAVRPWWDPAHEIKVCPDSIRPDVWQHKDARGRTLPCSALLAAPGMDPTSRCGCGPNLLRCAPRDLPAQLTEAMRDEVAATTARVVADDLPIADLFVGKSTARSRLVELLYLKSIAEAQRSPDPLSVLAAADGWKQDGKLVPRAEIEDGMHAGLITSPHVHFMSGDLRQRMRILYELLWCAEISAPGALPEHLLTLSTPNLATASSELSSRPICTNCHARLDSAMEFFSGHPNPVSGAWEFVPGAHGGRQGPLYGNDIRDRRGSGPLHARGFAELAIAQPEFARCMTRNAAEYVFGPATPAALVDRIAAEVVPTKVTFRDIMRSVLLEFIACEACAVPAIATPAGPAPARAELAQLVDQHCTACHFEGEPIPNLDRPLDEQLTLRALDQVLSGRMPPRGGLPTHTRLSFLGAAQRQLPAGVMASTAGFLQSHSDPPASLPLFAARESLHQAIDRGSHAAAVNAVENAVDGRENFLTPTYTVLTAVEAYRSCGNAAAADEPRTDCTRALLDNLWGMSAARHQQP